jgi:hypothetical protein
VEADGDIHIALEDATGDKIGTVSAEIPVGPKWCEIRQIVFGWTTQRFPFSVKTVHKLKIREPHVITVTGKAFYDIAHAPADHSNRRSSPKDYAVWEIHPVMALQVVQWSHHSLKSPLCSCVSITLLAFPTRARARGIQQIDVLFL